MRTGEQLTAQHTHKSHGDRKHAGNPLVVLLIKQNNGIFNNQHDQPEQKYLCISKYIYFFFFLKFLANINNSEDSLLELGGL